LYRKRPAPSRGTHRHLDDSSNEPLDSELEVWLDDMRALARDLEDV
jgi:hypothetical protein